MPICPITGLSFEHHELEKRHYERFGLPVPEIHPIARRIQIPRTSWRTTIDHWYPLLYPTPRQTRCAQCGDTMYSYIRPDKTMRKPVCDRCFAELVS